MKHLSRRAMDSLDKQVIKALCVSGREPHNILAMRLGVSTGTIANRINALKNDGVLKGFRVAIDLDNLGYHLMAIVMIYSEDDSALEPLEESKNVVGVFEVEGECILIAWVACRNMEEFRTLMKSIRDIPGVKRANPHIILNVVKDPYSYIPEIA
jgi:DNA-binding Lrp family transcriptional regulator